jgi:demethoxyubiquinone hydroxylase (CLK1/Coq7/Cat5 family)
MRLASRPGLVVPLWVSLCNVLGWAIALVAGTWVMVNFGG